MTEDSSISSDATKSSPVPDPVVPVQADVEASSGFVAPDSAGEAGKPGSSDGDVISAMASSGVEGQTVLAAGSGSTVVEVANVPPEPVTYKISDKVVVATDPSSPQAEAVAALRTHLLSHHFGRGRRGVALCSPSSRSGTTFIAVNLAVSFARTGLKTLLIDANLRQPAVHKMIVPSREMPALKSMLVESESDFGSIIQENVMPNLSLIYSGGTSAYAQELLSGGRFKSLIDLCMREFDVTIVDTPAGNTNADGRRIAAVVRHAIIVARKDWTYVSDVRTLIEELQLGSVNVAGTIYNEY